MTVSTTNVAKAYQGTGSPTGTVYIFPVDFQFWDDDEIVVYIRTIADGSLSSAQTVAGGHFTLTGGNGSTGTLAMTVAPTSAETIHIIRVSSLDQQSDLTPAVDVPTATIEQMIDRQALSIQEARNAGETRSMLIPQSDMDTAGDYPSMELPDKAARGVSGALLGFNASGEPIIVVDSLPTGTSVTAFGAAWVALANEAAALAYLPAVEDGGEVQTIDAGTFALRPIEATFGKGFYFATDRDQLYYSDGTSWNLVTINQGPISVMPASAAANTGALYIDTDNMTMSRDSGSVWETVESPWMQGSISGLEMTNASLVRLTINAGEARSHLGNSDHGLNMKLTSAINKDLSLTPGDWVEGNNQPGMAAGVAQAVDTWYYVFLIAKEDGTVDAAFDDNINATNILGGSGEIFDEGFDQHIRYIGRFRTNTVSSGSIIGFNQYGDHFELGWVFAGSLSYDASIDASASNDLVMAYAPYDCLTDINWSLEIGTFSVGYVKVGSVYGTTQGSIAGNPLHDAYDDAGAHTQKVGRGWIRTDATGQIRVWGDATSDTTSVFRAHVNGWIDDRGKNP